MIDHCVSRLTSRALWDPVFAAVWLFVTASWFAHETDLVLENQHLRLACGLRKTLPAIREGSADYAAATATAAYSLVLREAQGRRAGADQFQTADRGQPDRDEPRSTRHVDRRTLRRAHTSSAPASVTMQPYQVRVLVQ